MRIYRHRKYLLSVDNAQVEFYVTRAWISVRVLHLLCFFPVHSQFNIRPDNSSGRVSVRRWPRSLEWVPYVRVRRMQCATSLASDPPLGRLPGNPWRRETRCVLPFVTKLFLSAEERNISPNSLQFRVAPNSWIQPQVLLLLLYTLCLRFFRQAGARVTAQPISVVHGFLINYILILVPLSRQKRVTCWSRPGRSSGGAVVTFVWWGRVSTTPRTRRWVRADQLSTRVRPAFATPIPSLGGKIN